MSYTPEELERQREYSKRHYQNNKQQYRDRNKARRKEMNEFIRQYKEFHGCKDCEQKYPYFMLDLDHRDPSGKSHEPALLSRTGNWSKITEELAKCDVVCANCHRIRTHERGYKKAVSEKKEGAGVSHDDAEQID